MGATISIRFNRSGQSAVSLATSPTGEFVFEKLRAGYYFMEITARGFEPRPQFATSH
jgi:hypothetical protein